MVADIHTERWGDDAFVVGLAETRGRRVSMEDAHTVKLFKGGEERVKHAFFAVFDGHNGRATAEYGSEHLYERVVSSSAFIEGNYEAALREAFLAVDGEILEKEVSEDGFARSSGSTAVCALVINDSIYVANAGDSRCVVCVEGKAVALSTDHKPGVESERARVEKAGSSVRFGRVAGILAVSRALGDHPFKGAKDLTASEQAVTADPEVVVHARSRGDTYLVLACDGIWDVLSNQELCEIVTEKFAAGVTDVAKICEDVVSECGSGVNRKDGDDGRPRVSFDNMTLLIARFDEGRLARGHSNENEEKEKELIPFDEPSTPEKPKKTAEVPATPQKAEDEKEELDDPDVVV